MIHTQAICFMLQISEAVKPQLMHDLQRKLNRRVIRFAIVTRFSRFSSQQKVTSQPHSLASPIGHHPPFHLHVQACTGTESTAALCQTSPRARMTQAQLPSCSLPRTQYSVQSVTAGYLESKATWAGYTMSPAPQRPVTRSKKTE